jgi:prevent-host-death family protein
VKRATITETKNQLSAVLDQVRAGETVLILDRGRPVARIEPVGAAEGGDALLGRLERAGLLRRARARIRRRFLDDPPPAAARGASALEALLEERDRGR